MAQSEQLTTSQDLPPSLEDSWVSDDRSVALGDNPVPKELISSYREPYRLSKPGLDSLRSQMTIPTSAATSMWCSEFVIDVCRRQEGGILSDFLDEYGYLVKPNHRNWLAWKESVNNKDQYLCRVLVDYFGPRIIYDSRCFFDLYSTKNFDSVIFVLDLLQGTPFTDCKVVEVAASHNHRLFIDRVLDSRASIYPTHIDSAYNAAITGAILGDHEDLFDSILGRFMSNNTSNSTSNNQTKLIHIAKKQDYAYFSRAFRILDCDWDYYRTTGCCAKLYCKFCDLVNICCHTRDSRFTNDLEPIILSHSSPGPCLEMAELACRNGHPVIARKFAKNGPIKSVLSLFLTAARSNKFDVNRALLDERGIELVSQIESQETENCATVRDLLREYFLGLASKYSDEENSNKSYNHQPIRRWNWCHSQMKVNGILVSAEQQTSPCIRAVDCAYNYIRLRPELIAVAYST